MENSIVTLNVGGCLFQTSKATLEMHDTFFRALVENANIDETVFIDRDPSYFRYILNWLRGTHVLPEDKLSLKELMYECDFYCINDMKEEIEKIITVSSTVIEKMSKIENELKYVYR